jgi:CHAT domain-containing protein
MKNYPKFFFSIGVGMAIAMMPILPNPIAILKSNRDETKDITKDITAVAQTPPNYQERLQQGREFFQAEQFSQAAMVWQQAVTESNRAGDSLHEALALNYLSLAAQKLGQWPEAKNAIASCIALIKTPKKTDFNAAELSILAQALNTQGHLEYATGQTEAALSSWQDAAKTYAQINDTAGAIGAQINQAQAMQTLGLYRRSRTTLEAVEIAMKNEPDSLIKATGLRSLGNVLRASGDLAKSRELLQQSLTISQNLRLSSAIAEAELSLANTAKAIAKNALEFKDQKTANTEIKIALDGYQKVVDRSNSPALRLRSQLNQLSLLIDTKKIKEAQSLVPLIQQQIEQLPISRQSVNARINWVNNLMRLSFDPDSSLNERSPIYEMARELAIAVQQAKILNDPRTESYALGSLGKLYELTKQPEEAKNITEKALVLAQSINATEIAYRWQWQLGRVLKAQGNRKEAIAAYSVAVETLQSLRKDLAAINTDNPDIQFSFRDSIDPVYREFVSLLTDPNEEPTQENLRAARQAIEYLQLAELDNFFQEACLDAKPVQIDQVDPTAAVIYPIILPDRLAVIVALPNAPLRLYNTLENQEKVESEINKLMQNIARESGNNKRGLETAQQIYNWLILPAESDLKNSQVQTLVFILDGLLRNIPMAALHDGKKYLIETYSIALNPGLQLLPSQPLFRENLKVLIAGLSAARHGFSALPNVEKEIQQITTEIPSQVILNEEFTNATLQEQINSLSFPVVHIATHGQFSSQAENTFILSWDGKINVKDLDHFLRKKKAELSRPIELLVFSACETAAGDDRAALGLAGVVVRAGARSTLATLWQVSDDSTAQLMVRFYQELARDPNVSKAEALRRAQLNLLQQDGYKFPYFWSPYVLVGNWR